MPDAPSPRTVLGMLADAHRLRVVAAVALGHRRVEDIVAVTGDGPGAVHRALERLLGAGLLDVGPAGLSLREDAFARAVRALADQERAARADAKQMFAVTDADQAGVLRNFVDADGRLRQIPAAAAKRRVVLDWLAQRFDPGRVYPERDVNFELGKIHPDAAALRRYLVDEGFMERRDGFYWRAGGTYDV